MLNPVQKAIIFLGVCVAGVMCLDACAPDCTGKPAGSKVPDPVDCKQYYLCLNGGVPTDHPLWCESGEIFDEAIEDCRVGSDCKPKCPPTTSGCHFTCNFTYDLVSDPLNCGQYFVCLPHGLGGPLACPEGSRYFDGEKCVDDEGACCSDKCTPFCEAAATQVPDPSDCTKYYICLDSGPASEDYHFQCDAGENFNIVTGLCDSGASCVTICGDSNVSPPPSDPSTVTSDPSNPSTLTPNPSTSTLDPSTSSTSTLDPSTSTTSTLDPSTLTPSPSPSPTPTPSPSLASTSQETTTVGCVDSLTCTALGSFSKCNICQKEFFYCDTVGQEAGTYTCTGDLLFNTDPAYPFCVLPANCPYHPPYDQ